LRLCLLLRLRLPANIFLRFLVYFALALNIAIKVDENDTEQIKNTVQFHNDFLSHLGTLSSDGL
jgi:hypothetical protein